MQPTVFLVEDNATTQKLLTRQIEEAGYGVRAFERAEPCLEALRSEEPATVCLDIELPGMSGLDALTHIAERRPHLPVILLTAERDAAVGVRAMKMGAADYLLKPVDREALAKALAAAVHRHELVLEVRRLKAQVAESLGGSEIIGQTPVMHELRGRLGLVLQNDVTVFLHGESGTGKELIARSVHQGSSRATRPFVAVNCGAIPKDLQESYFFGHERGAFTGADRRHEGFFEEAEGGTLFLDEVGELTLDAQVKLLRALQEREIRRVGGSRDMPVDVRVISASNRDLPAMIRAGEFREDLYYRLVVYPVRVPALRDRRSDIPLLAGHFLNHYADQLGLPVPDMARETLECLLDHPWPGNVRELQNAIQFALLAGQGEVIRPEHLPESLPRTPAPAVEPVAEDAVSLLDPATGEVRNFESLEREIFLRVLALAGDNVTEAARLLGIGRATFYRRLSAWAETEGGEIRRAS